MSGKEERRRAKEQWRTQKRVKVKQCQRGNVKWMSGKSGWRCKAEESRGEEGNMALIAFKASVNQLNYIQLLIMAA